MSTRSVEHHTFAIERAYPTPPATVFAAWATPASKARWFAPDAEHRMDFRVGGIERNRGGGPDGTALVFESTYHDIVDDERIVFTSNLLRDGTVVTVSVTTVELHPARDGGTRLVLTQQSTFLDGYEQRDWREAGTRSQLDALAAELHA